MKIDKKLIKELSEYLDEFNLTEIEFTEKDTKIKVSKNNISLNNQTTSVLENKQTDKEISQPFEKINSGMFGLETAKGLVVLSTSLFV